jgi:hypothetical protein
MPKYVVSLTDRYGKVIKVGYTEQAIDSDTIENSRKFLDLKRQALKQQCGIRIHKLEDWEIN